MIIKRLTKIYKKMNKFKFYFLSALICGFSLGFTACGDDDDDEETSSSEQMKGGDIVGSWAINEDASSYKTEGADALMSLMGESFDMESMSDDIVDMISGNLTFNDDNTFNLLGEEEDENVDGTYETSGSNLAMTGKYADGTEFVLKAGEALDMLDMMVDDEEDSEFDFSSILSAVTSNIKSVKYNVDTQLTITAVVEITIDLTSIEIQEGISLYDMMSLTGSVDKVSTITLTATTVFDRD